MISLFGLVHGFGLSTRLQELPLSETDLLMNIVSFNVGVELGQVLALTVMLALLAGWRKAKSFQSFSRVSNVGLIFAGTLLFLMQMHGYAHVSNPDEFGFSADNHHHEHLRLNQEAAAALSHHQSID